MFSNCYINSALVNQLVDTFYTFETNTYILNGPEPIFTATDNIYTISLKLLCLC